MRTDSTDNLRTSPAAAAAEETLKHIGLSDIQFEVSNHRKEMDEAKLAELADSIAAIGVQQPIKVCKRGMRYVMVFGHRRLRASSLAGKTTVPAIVVTGWTDQQIAEAQVVENILREDINPIEEACCVRTLVDGGADLAAAAAKMNKSKDWCRLRLDLLRLDPKIQALAASGRLPIKHAGLIARVGDLHDQANLATIAVGGDIAGGGDYVIPLERLRMEIGYILCKLGGAHWPKDVGYAGKRACEGCVNNTNTEPALFEGVKLTSTKGNCTNQTCFETKARAWENDPVKLERDAKREAGKAAKAKNGQTPDKASGASLSYAQREKQIAALKRKFPWTPAQAHARAMWEYGKKLVEMIEEFIASGQAAAAMRPVELIVLNAIAHKQYSASVSDDLPTLAEIAKGHCSNEGARKALAETWGYNAAMTEYGRPGINYNGEVSQVPLDDGRLDYINGVEAIAWAWKISEDLPTRPDCEFFVREFDLKAIVKARRDDASKTIGECVDAKLLREILDDDLEEKKPMAKWRRNLIAERVAEIQLPSPSQAPKT